MKYKRIINILSGLALSGLLVNVAQAAESVPVFHADVVNTYPHDENAFTQGLTIINGELYEGTGRNGQSSIRLLELETGEVLKRRNLSSRYFGEGITILQDKIYQLTWRSSLGFVYEKESFNLTKTFFLPGEGWGLTDDDESLIVSDGTAFLRFLDPDTLEEVRRIEVIDGNRPIDRLNELEYIKGEIWANIWYTDLLVRIDPNTGRVNSYVDLTDLYPQRNSSEDVLNGIAWDDQNQRVLVTGKLWSKIFEIKILE